MESGQINHIRRYLQDLIDYTDCSPFFLSYLKGERVLTSDEVDDLVSKRSYSGNTTEEEFYTIIQTRENGFDKLKDALDVTGQEGAFAILNLFHDEDGNLQMVHGSAPEAASAPASIEGAPSVLGNAGHQGNVIGKITIDYSKKIGDGCGDTKVYEGHFEGKDIPVAVKRILAGNFRYAEREINLLKQVRDHQNVVRYYGTEKVDNYYYIALDLCVATLGDWVEGKYKNDSIDAFQVLQEASQGLSYIHSQHIIHRDLKPENILLRDGSAGLRAVVSDFGFSKMADGNKSSVKPSSGLRGTDGWIAPEIIISGIDSTVRLTKAVDIFSMGCIFFYVITYKLLTKAHHPFEIAESSFKHLARQTNILNNVSDLFNLTGDTKGIVNIIRLMVLPHDHADERPTIKTVLEHPMFWTKENILGFFTAISDLIVDKKNKNDKETHLVERFETGGKHVVRGNWLTRISKDVANGLGNPKTKGGKYNGKGDSVTDLLRSVRNSANHFNEKSADFQKTLGGSKDESVNYWMKIFPVLLPYTWVSFEELKDETSLTKYYSPEFDFGYDNYVAYISKTPPEKANEDRVDEMPRLMVEDILAKNNATGKWTIERSSKSPPTFKCVWTISFKSGQGLGGNKISLRTLDDVEGSGEFDREAEQHAAFRVLAKSLTKPAAEIVQDVYRDRDMQTLQDQTHNTFRSSCTVTTKEGEKISVEGRGENKEKAEENADLRVITKLFTSGELTGLTDFTNI